MYQAIQLEKLFYLRVFRRIKKIFHVIFWISLGFFVFGFLEKKFSEPMVSRFLSIVFLSFSLSATIFLLESFFQRLKNPRFAGSPNVPEESLSFEGTQAILDCLSFIKRRKLPFITSTVFLYFLFKRNPRFEIVFSRLLLDGKEIKNTFEKEIQAILEEENTYSAMYYQDFQGFLIEAMKISREYSHQRIENGDLLGAAANLNQPLKKILVQADVTSQDIQNVSSWIDAVEKRIAERKQFWHAQNLARYGTLAKNWAAGYTAGLDKFSYDLTETVQLAGFPRAVGHTQELQAVERILSRQQTNNVLLVGEPGSGRKRIILELASRSALGESLPEINYKRVIELDLLSLLAQFPKQGDRQASLDAVFKEVVKAGNVILVIDEFHNYVGGKGEEEGAGFLNISGIIARYLPLPESQIVAITTFAGLHRSIEQNPSLLALFEKVEVSEISQDETLLILEHMIPAIEKKSKKFISYPALKAMIAFSVKYVQAVPLPQKAIDLLDEAAAYLSQTKEKVLLPKHIAVIVSEKTQIPVGEIESKEKEVLLNLEDLVHKRIINQEEAVKEVASAMRRARAQISPRKGPMGTFLFLGPTGVGKTETAKALAAMYFGSESRMIRLDMSEFQNPKDIDRLLGSSSQEGLLTTPVRENPFSLILLDEIEKTHPNTLNLFLQVLDEGHITDGFGRKVSFQHTMIIATSNAGYKLILDAIKQNMDFTQLKQKMLDFFFQEGVFRPEFLNRFDALVIFRPLGKTHLLQIAELMLGKVKKSLEDKGIEFLITDSLKEKIVELGYDPIFGARPMKRAIQDKVENPLAVALLREEMKRGDKVEVDAVEFTVQKR